MPSASTTHPDPDTLLAPQPLPHLATALAEATGSRWVHAPWERLPSPRTLEVIRLTEQAARGAQGSTPPQVFAALLTAHGFTADSDGSVPVPLVYGMCGAVERSVRVHAFDEGAKLAVVFVADVATAARAIVEGLAAPGVDGLVLTVRGGHAGGTRAAAFDTLVRWLDDLMAPRRLTLPSEGITLVGW